VRVPGDVGGGRLPLGGTGSEVGIRLELTPFCGLDHGAFLVVQEGRVMARVLAFRHHSRPGRYFFWYTRLR
jgi:hypothetical protein